MGITINDFILQILLHFASLLDSGKVFVSWKNLGLSLGKAVFFFLLVKAVLLSQTS